MSDRRTVSIAIASAFLAGPWEAAAMAARARDALEGRAPWLRNLAREVLTAYERAPLDRHRELTAYVELALDDHLPRHALAEPLERQSPAGAPAAVAGPLEPQSPAGAAAALAPPLRVRRMRLFEPAMGRMRWDVPQIPTPADLAAFLDITYEELLWLADPRGWARDHAAEPLRHYRHRWVARRIGPPRLLEAPKPRLKAIQRRLLREVLDRIPPDDAAHGFTAGRSARSNAAVHSGRAVVLCLDLEDFFASVSAGRVYGTYRTAGYPEAVAHLLTGLTTARTPRHVTEQAADPLRRRLAAPHLPQGAPTSPALANLAAFALDRRLGGLAAACGATYTRYADDLAFSGGPELHRSAPRLRRAAAAVVRDEGFRVNAAKTRYMTAAGRQRVTGAVVNVRPNVAREEYDRLKALLHEAARSGPAVANRRQVPDLRAHVLGRISWVESLNPARGARLRAAFAAVAWT